MPQYGNRRAFGLFATVFALVVLLESQGSHFACAQSMTRASDPTIEDLRRQISELHDEMDRMRERDAQRRAWEDSIIKRLPSARLHLASDTPCDCDAAAPGCDCRQAPACGCTQVPACDGCAHACGCCCGCYPCQCPLPKAPCICCPHVSTLNPYFNVHIFGALKTDLIFSEARPASPGTPFFLFPKTTTPGFDESSVSVHARQSTIGAVLTGPQFHGLQSGGLLMAVFFNDNVLADQYGFLPLQAWADLKNENWRFAAGLQFDVFSPGAPTMLPFSILAASGNAGNSFRGSVRLERYLHPTTGRQWTLQFALSDPINSTIDPTFRLRRGQWLAER